MSVTLSKGQSVSLAKEAGGTLTKVRLGLGWDARLVKGLFGKMKEQSIDLDASALLRRPSGFEIVFYGQLDSRDGSVHHTGDNRTGAGDGDDESIIVDLTRVPSDVDEIYFTVNSFSGETFDQIENAFVRVVDSQSHDRELARFSLSGSGRHTAMVMAKVRRTSLDWEFTAIGRPANGKTANQLIEVVSAL